MKSDYSTVLYSLPGMIILVIIEGIELARDRNFGKGKNAMFANFFMGVIAIIVATTTKGIVLLFYTWLYHFKLLTIPAGVWWAWVICFVADDLSYYWFHRCGHHIRFFWASHIVHHSPQTFTLTTAFRLPWTSHLTGNFAFWWWMPLLGISPSMVISMKAASTIYQLWLHTEKIKKLPGWIEAIFNTPSHHRVHHGTEVDHLDKNLGGTLIIWDRLFGTFCKETRKPIYGLTQNINSCNPFVIELSEWGNLINDLKRSRSARDCVNFIFNSPGWSNDGNIKTTKSLRAK
jgi:sterol desaturase/sphingolipid hydroxylase (fatty acid hydroxylase superfamily)